MFKSILSAMVFITVVLGSLIQAQAQDVKLGSFKVTSTSEKILGQEAASIYEEVLKKDEEITWYIYVPENYDPSKPIGILLYQIYGGAINEPIGWKSVMEDKNLILVRLSVAGRLIDRKEMLIGILSMPMLQEKYNIDTTRIYNTANNGCHVAGTTAKLYPNIVKGSIYVNCIPSTWRNIEPEYINLMRNNRYVFVYGRDSMSRTGLKQAEQRYNDNGILNTKFVSLSRISAGDNIDRRALLEAIDYLDEK